MTAHARRLAVLGATGSIGKHTLEVVRQHAGRLEVYALAARSDWQGMLPLVHAFRPEVVAMEDADAALALREALGRHQLATDIVAGADAVASVATLTEVDTVVAGISGFAGLPSAWRAVTAGKRLLLANKEALVASGRLLLAAAESYGAVVVPLDSEHNALHQCLGGLDAPSDRIARLTLTASGGPFRTRDLPTFSSITPEEACRHPTWSMGRKISVDSATLANKGLEVIEAALLYRRSGEDIDVLIHPTSTVHALVEFVDRSVLAHLGPSNMCVPIAHALGLPDRLPLALERLDLARLGRLEFFPVDQARYPMLGLAYRALAAGQGACLALNASNEVAVQAFLDRRIGYPDIVAVVEETLARCSIAEPCDIEAVFAADRHVRELAVRAVADRRQRNVAT